MSGLSMFLLCAGMWVLAEVLPHWIHMRALRKREREARDELQRCSVNPRD